MLWTDKLEETIEFYTSLLGFVLVEKNDDWNWACLQKDEIEIMLVKPNAHMPFEKAFFTGSIYIVTNNIDLLWNNLKERVTVCYEIENFDWGMREFAIYDINGYIFQFGQEINTE